MVFYAGKYSIIQYCPDPSRKERLNVGVLLEIPEIHYRKVKYVKAISRLENAFGLINKSFFQKQLSSLEEVVADIHNIQDFLERKVDKIRMTKFEVIKIVNPDQELEELFLDFVGEKPRVRTPRVRTILRQKFEESNITEHLVKPKPIELEVGKVPYSIVVPYGFQNGCFQLIDAVNFAQESTKERIEEVFAKAREGELLSQEQTKSGSNYKLNIIGKFDGKNDGFFEFAKNEFSQHSCELHSIDNLRIIEDKIIKASVHSKH